MITLRKDRISVAMAGLQGRPDARDTSARGLIEWVAARGVRYVQLNAAMAGTLLVFEAVHAERHISRAAQRLGHRAKDESDYHFVLRHQQGRLKILDSTKPFIAAVKGATIGGGTGTGGGTGPKDSGNGCPCGLSGTIGGT